MNHAKDCDCPDCCEHDDIDVDERCCLVCGKDMTEDLCAEAEARADMLEDR